MIDDDVVPGAAIHAGCVGGRRRRTANHRDLADHIDAFRLDRRGNDDARGGRRGIGRHADFAVSTIDQQVRAIVAGHAYRGRGRDGPGVGQGETEVIGCATLDSGQHIGQFDRDRDGIGVRLGAEINDAGV